MVLILPSHTQEKGTVVLLLPSHTQEKGTVVLLLPSHTVPGLCILQASCFDYGVPCGTDDIVGGIDATAPAAWYSVVEVGFLK